MEKYIIQKAQKIVSALYLVTDLIKDSEVLKWEIREECIIFVSNAHVLNSTLPGDKGETSHVLLLSLEKLISYLNVALISGVISRMNANILIHEIESIKNFINKNIEGIQLPGYILSDSFFQTDAPAVTNLVNQKKFNDTLRTANNNLETKVKIDVKDKKNGRQESILALLKKDSHLTIKDFAKVITDCSEKTIQRELISLVEKGLVKREGERRWSTYSLA
jgi:hypothetical protein